MPGRGRHPRNRLTDLEVRQARPGRHADGNGLYLFVRPTGARSCRRGPSNGRRRATGSTSPSETTEPPQSGHLDGHGSRTSTTKRVRQPEHRPGRVSRRSGCVVGR